jgi:hypothetical protein
MQNKTKVSHLLLENNNLAWFYLKIKKMKQMYDDPRYYFKDLEMSDQLEKEIKESLKIEIVTSVDQLAEVFGIYMECFHDCNKVIHKKILNYRVNNVIDFYQKIHTKKISYIRKMLGYPSFSQVSNKGMSIKLNESAKNVKKMLIRISKFYLKYRFLYNSLKHGLRVFPMFIGEDSKSKSYTLVLTEKLDTEALHNLDFKEAVEIYEYMAILLRNTMQVYKDRVIDKKSSYNVHIYPTSFDSHRGPPSIYLE